MGPAVRRHSACFVWDLKILKFGSSSVLVWTASSERWSNSQGEGRYSVERLSVQKALRDVHLGSTGGRVGLGWEHTESLVSSWRPLVFWSRQLLQHSSSNEDSLEKYFFFVVLSGGS